MSLLISSSSSPSSEFSKDFSYFSLAIQIKSSNLIPYFDLALIRNIVSLQEKLYLPLTILYLTPGKSLALPPQTNTSAYTCNECPWPFIFAVTINKFERRDLTILLFAELGFLGLINLNLVAIPFFCGESKKDLNGLQCIFFLRPLKIEAD